MYNLIVFLPLIGSILAWIFGNKFSSLLAYFCTVFCMILAMIISWIAFFDIAINKNLFDGFISFVNNLNKVLNIPASLTEMGLKNPNIKALVQSALNDPSCSGNPIKLNKENMTRLFESCL